MGVKNIIGELQVNGSPVITADSVIGTWVFNDELVTFLHDVTTQEEFDKDDWSEEFPLIGYSMYENDRYDFTAIYCYRVNGTFNTSVGLQEYDNLIEVGDDTGAIWYEDGMWYTKTITITKEPSAEVAEWIRANATKQNINERLDALEGAIDEIKDKTVDKVTKFDACAAEPTLMNLSNDGLMWSDNFAMYTSNGDQPVCYGNIYHRIPVVAGDNISIEANSSTFTINATGSNSYNDLTDVPTEFTPSEHGHTKSEITDFPVLATVATSGSYNDLSDKPTIPSTYTHPTSHPASMITGLATVATSGSYNDLSNKPTIPAAVTVDSALSSTSTNPVQNKVINSALAGKAASSHGNHVPATETANNAKFLRNDNTWQTVTPANIGAAAASHGTHVTYATATPSANGTAAVGTSSKVSREDHVHPLQTTVSGKAGSADKLNTNAGSVTQPVYFANGVPVKTTYTLGASVPSGAKFTDTTYSDGTGISLSGTTFSNSAALYYVPTLTVKQKGSSTSGAYLASKWSVANVDGITTPTDGMSIAIRTPADGFNGGILLSIDNGTTYYPIVRNANTLVTTTYAAGSTVIITFNATQKASPYTSANATTEITGCWQTADYDANTKTTTNSTNKVDAKLFIVGATKQGSSQTTYSNQKCYVGSDNCLYSNGMKVLTTENNTVYTHPVYTARTGKPTANQTPAFGGTAIVSQITSDETGHVTGATDRTITIPSTLSNGTETAGLIKTSSTVTSNSGYTACPVISGVPYYKELTSWRVSATVSTKFVDGLYLCFVEDPSGQNTCTLSSTTGASIQIHTSMFYVYYWASAGIYRVEYQTTSGYWASWDLSSYIGSSPGGTAGISCSKAFACTTIMEV